MYVLNVMLSLNIESKTIKTCFYDDEPTIFCINQDKNIDNEVHFVRIEFPNLHILLTIFVPFYRRTQPRGSDLEKSSRPYQTLEPLIDFSILVM
jgi:hypothetical protein